VLKKDIKSLLEGREFMKEKLVFGGIIFLIALFLESTSLFDYFLSNIILKAVSIGIIAGTVYFIFNKQMKKSKKNR